MYYLDSDINSEAMTTPDIFQARKCSTITPPNQKTDAKKELI
jgi:hypothetical protein